MTVPRLTNIEESGRKMKVGDLVTVAPGHEFMYLLVSIEAPKLQDCVILFHPKVGPLPMNKEHVRVISESR